MNKIVKNLAIQNFQNFAHSFEDSKNLFWDEKIKRLKHSGEFGTYREELIKRWLQLITPPYLGIGSGFIIGPKGAISTQCDVVVFDEGRTPVLSNMDSQRFFPVETVCCVGEVKSIVNSNSQLNEYLIKLAKVKQIREEVHNPTPYFRTPNLKNNFNTEYYHYDNVFSFLICKKLDFDLSKLSINYEKIPNKYRHNLILSIDDGLIAYKSDKNSTTLLSFPCVGLFNHIDHFERFSNEDIQGPEYVIKFLALLHRSFVETTLLEIDMAPYLTDNITDQVI